MSTIGSVSSNSMSTLLQRLAQNTQTTSTGKAQGPTAAQRAEFEKKFEAAAKAAGLDVDKLKSIQSDIQTAVSNTIQNYSDPTDKAGLQDAIQTAVDDVLKQNGFDPETVKKQLQTARDSMGMGKGQPMGPPPPPPTDESGATTSTSDSTQTTKTQSLMSLLRILEGSQNSQNTQTDQTSLLETLASSSSGLNLLA
jgi:hypothetical protein